MKLLSGNSQDVVNFRNAVSSGKGRSVPGLPKMNPDRVVHGSQTIEILKALPHVSGSGWKLKKRTVGISENSMSPSVVVD